MLLAALVGATLGWTATAATAAVPGATLSAGGAHSCAIRSDGRIVCWGDDSQGQVSGAPAGEFTAVAAGGAHSCAIRSDRRVVCWGDDSKGQVSGAEAANTPQGDDDEPRRGRDDDDDDVRPEFTAVAAGGAHSCALRTDGGIVCWGDDSQGQVSGAPEGEFTAVAAGGAHSCALRIDGRVVCWGNDSNEQVSGTPGGEFATVAAGGAHSCAMTASGAVRCWGDNSAGQSQPELTAGALPRAVIGSPYSAMLETTPQSPLPLFGVLAGPLPPGLGLDPAGELSGEATTAGDYPVMFAASNGVTPDAVAEATLTVVGAPQPAVGPATAITTTSATLHGSVDPRNLPAEAWFESWPAGEPTAATKTAAQEVSAGIHPVPLSAQLSGLAPAGEYEFRLAAANELGAAPLHSKVGRLTTAAPPAPPKPQGLPAPTAGETVNVEPVEGVVATDCGEGGFEGLHVARQIPVGCLIDTRAGTVGLTASKGSSGETETGDFWAGIFRVTQNPGDNQDAVLTLAGRLKCEKRRPGARGRARASRGGRRGGRGLWGSGKGNFKTTGSYGSASVRGTVWFVKDRCDNSTLAKVVEGTVWFRDFVKGTTIVLEPGEQYLAKAAIPRLPF